MFKCKEPGAQYGSSEQATAVKYGKSVVNAKAGHGRRRNQQSRVVMVRVWLRGEEYAASGKVKAHEWYNKSAQKGTNRVVELRARVQGKASR